MSVNPEIKDVESIPLHIISHDTQKPIDFFSGVVVGQTDSYHAAGLFYSQPLGDGQGVVVPMPDKNTSGSQCGGNFSGGFALLRERQSGTSHVKLVIVYNSVYPDPRNLL